MSASPIFSTLQIGPVEKGTSTLKGQSSMVNNAGISGLWHLSMKPLTPIGIDSYESMPTPSS